MAGLSTYWHTLKYLKPIQVYSRVIRALRPPLLRMAPVSHTLATDSGTWVAPVSGEPSMLAPWTFRFLGEERSFESSSFWQPPGASLLWLYNLHYFDDLNAQDALQRKDWHQGLVRAWIENNAPGTKPAWDSYPTSLRIVNLIKWVLAGGRLSQTALASLALQAQWLSRRIEWHLLGNHLFANAKALVFAGCYFESREASRWLSSGQAILARELDEQVLADGGNFELSPMYHAIFLADVLDLINLSRRFPTKVLPAVRSALERRAVAMLEWLSAMVHPDGEIALFNDSAIGIAPTLEELQAYAARLSLDFLPVGRSSSTTLPMAKVLERSGYVRLECAQAVAICDVAEIGPDYLPGHAHADTLAFELSVGGQRFIVNGGTSQYGSGAARVRERGTPAHSTVTVDELDSSEVWSGFRVARRARPFDVIIEAQPHAVRLEASHDGYRRLHRSIVHRRRWILAPQSMTIEDRVSGRWKSATARFILHHQIAISPLSRNGWLLRHLQSGQEVRITVLHGAARVERAAHSLRFGGRLETNALAVDLDRAGAKIELTWTPK